MPSHSKKGSSGLALSLSFIPSSVGGVVRLVVPARFLFGSWAVRA